VKRRDLLRRVAIAAMARGLAWELVRQGSEHEVWALNGRRITIPRHREINERTARDIMKAFEEEFGRRWWER
jgi:mRNA interferase HicA